MKFSRGDIPVRKRKETPDGPVFAYSYEDAGRPIGVQHYVAGKACMGLRVVDEADRARALFRRAPLALGGGGGKA
jgi:hypothetical protein